MSQLRWWVRPRPAASTAYRASSGRTFASGPALFAHRHQRFRETEEALTLDDRVREQASELLAREQPRVVGKPDRLGQILCHRERAHRKVLQHPEPRRLRQHLKIREPIMRL